jgi:hypothetical protein
LGDLTPSPSDVMKIPTEARNGMKCVPITIQPQSTEFVKASSVFWKCSKSGEDKQIDGPVKLCNEDGQPGLKGLERFLQ